MNDAELGTLADEILAAVRMETSKVLGPIQARLAEVGPILASLNAEVETLKARIEQVAKEPRVVIEPKFIVPQGAAPVVHVSPVLQMPERKPMNRTIKKAADGSFEVTDKP